MQMTAYVIFTCLEFRRVLFRSADATIQCPAAPAFGTPVFSDTCDTNLTVTFVDASLGVSGNEVSKTQRTWTATDAHTNSVTCSQTITVIDSSAPTVTSCPADATIQGREALV